MQILPPLGSSTLERYDTLKYTSFEKVLGSPTFRFRWDPFYHICQWYTLSAFGILQACMLLLLDISNCLNLLLVRQHSHSRYSNLERNINGGLEILLQQPEPELHFNIETIKLIHVLTSMFHHNY